MTTRLGRQNTGRCGWCRIGVFRVLSWFVHYVHGTDAKHGTEAKQEYETMGNLNRRDSLRAPSISVTKETVLSRLNEP